MNEGLAVLTALLLLSAMLSTILALAWATLGRARHALTWAVAFAVATVQWAANIAHFLIGGSPLLFMAVNALAVVVAALLALGFRQRGGAGRHALPLVLGGGATIALIFVATFVVEQVAVARAAPLLFRAVVLAAAAAAVAPRGRPANAAERCAIGMLWAFVLFNIVVAATALAWSGGGRFADLDRWILLLGLPPAFAGTGLFAVFLIAADLAERMRDLASRDPLTGVLNRRGFEEQAARLIANAARHRLPLSLALADLDRFKAVNDLHGHAAGDAALCRFAESVGSAVRQGDLFARLGGEEFVLLLVGTAGPAAVSVVDRLRREAATQTLSTEPPTTVTTSFGVAALAPGETSLDSLIARADRALYQAKQAGRDRVSLAATEA